jgi:hypothetical protein
LALNITVSNGIPSISAITRSLFISKLKALNMM